MDWVLEPGLSFLCTHSTCLVASDQHFNFSICVIFFLRKNFYIMDVKFPSQPPFSGQQAFISNVIFANCTGPKRRTVCVALCHIMEGNALEVADAQPGMN